MQQPLTLRELEQEHSSPKVKAGTYAWDAYGRLWCYVQASTAITPKGTALTPAAAVLNADVDTAGAVDTREVADSSQFTTSNLVDMETRDEPNGHTYYLWFDANDSQGQGGPIIRRVDDDSVDVYFVQSDDGMIDDAVTTTTDYQVFVPTRVRESQGITSYNVITGFAQKAITDEYWFWMLVKGMGIGLLDASDTAGAMALGLVQGTDAGYLQGADAAGAAAEVNVGISAYAFMDQDADGPIPIIADCPVIGRIPMPVDKTVEYPGLSI